MPDTFEPELFQIQPAPDLPSLCAHHDKEAFQPPRNDGNKTTHHFVETLHDRSIRRIPYVTGSKRGLDTRVSLKQALSSLGFKGGSRSETELNQWVQSEKQKLAMVMRENEIEWDQKGTHEQHLSVLDYKKKVREQEVEELTEHKNLLEHKLLL